MTISTYTAIGFAYWASYLINGDSPGLSDIDKAEADAWYTKSVEYEDDYISDVQDIGFEYDVWNGLGGDAALYTFIRQEPEE